MMKINDAHRKRPVRDDKRQKISVNRERKNVHRLYLKLHYLRIATGIKLISSS